jgi:hypothetical protein
LSFPLAARMCWFVFWRTRTWIPLSPVLGPSSSLRQKGRRPCGNNLGWWRRANSHLFLWWSCSYDCLWNLGGEQPINLHSHVFRWLGPWNDECRTAHMRQNADWARPKKGMRTARSAIPDVTCPYWKCLIIGRE